jgi:hypothetical protein
MKNVLILATALVLPICQARADLPEIISCHEFERAGITVSLKGDTANSPATYFLDITEMGGTPSREKVTEVQEVAAPPKSKVMFILHHRSRRRYGSGISRWRGYRTRLRLTVVMGNSCHKFEGEKKVGPKRVCYRYTGISQGPPLPPIRGRPAVPDGFGDEPIGALNFLSATYAPDCCRHRHGHFESPPPPTYP